nr:bifunctional diguanylate cyclase/phosphodiesterase [Acetobacter sp. AN02]
MVCRDNDFMARVGGDEFIIVQNGIQSLIDSLKAPVRIGENDALIGVSVGIALCPRDGTTATEVLKSGDIAMYRAKRAGKGQAFLYQPDMDTDVRSRCELEHDLRLAIEREELSLHYQPLVDSSGRIAGYEALARWNHPTRGMVSPAIFIPLAEESGLIIPLGKQILLSACQTAAQWPAGLTVAINISAVQVERSDLTGQIKATLEETGLDPHRLELEVTESMMIENTDEALSFVARMHALGVKIVLDDFGTGYSSLSYLQRVPFDKIKIDRSFIDRMADDASARTIVESIIGMSHRLHLRVTAEGIETSEQLALLLQTGCDEMQGFLLGRPMPATQIRADSPLSAQIGHLLTSRHTSARPQPEQTPPAAETERQRNKPASALRSLS